MMRKSHTTDLGTGLFVLLGFAAFFFLTTQTTTKGLSFVKDAHYDVTAKFDNIGDLKVGSLVSMAGVEIGRVARIDFDSKEYKAIVTMQLKSQYNEIPVDSDASINTQGLLGGKFIALSAGGSETYLKNKDQIGGVTQSALVLENLIGQFFANTAKASANKPPDSPATTEKAK
jgi:phospholipid/cholesterol/gamma-HCH transport system substrate-binding protein